MSNEAGILHHISNRDLSKVHEIHLSEVEACLSEAAVSVVNGVSEVVSGAIDVVTIVLGSGVVLEVVVLGVLLKMLLLVVDISDLLDVLVGGGVSFGSHLTLNS
eukprot:CAMPEP_0168615462 /NCGR_PEP_ID=MMETSP0449_2-20121227/4516_1 /TAXON_ID=1082188 /ORGANISM="Strombidium rassoulzadegani, Strain ras09" /LENGTH=103 /DNA_ID=CAMNT_0008656201 /DNA_START=99 /DNA_END=407 /DNA_ORIENTATION=-